MTEQELVLSNDQRRVLQMIYDEFREHGTWPTFGEVDRPLRRLGLNPEVIIQGLRRDSLVSFNGGRMLPVARDELSLALRGIAVCDGAQEDIGNFLRLVPWLAERELDFTPEERQPDLRVTGSEIKEFLQLPNEWAGPLSRLRQIIGLQRWGWSGGEQADGEWYIQVERSISRVGHVRTLEEYLEATAEWEQELQRFSPIPDGFHGTIVNEMGVEYSIDPEADTYVSASVVAALEAAAAVSSWNCDKLHQLVNELNQNFADRNIYSAHAMLRAILDHVPPILACSSFRIVANSYPWGQTDKKYMKRLLEFRDQADDALHRQISSKPDLLDLDDMPSSVGVSRLLQECAGKLLSSEHFRV